MNRRWRVTWLSGSTLMQAVVAGQLYDVINTSNFCWNDISPKPDQWSIIKIELEPEIQVAFGGPRTY